MSLNCITSLDTHGKRVTAELADDARVSVLEVNARPWLYVTHRLGLKLSTRDIGTEQEQRNILEVFHHAESLKLVNTIAGEQASIQKQQVWFAMAHEFQGRQTIRSADDLMCRLLHHPLNEQ